jgi:replication factor C large subunit
MTTTWTEKYRPKKFEEVKGQDLAVEKIKSFTRNFPSKKALVLYGSPGTGKTTIAHVMAGELNSEIFELNASDLRNRTKLQETLKPALEQKSLSSKGKIILIDEVDGISAVDRGGLQELLSLIKNSAFPIIITANDIWDRKFSSLRQKSEIVKMREVPYKIIKEILIGILKQERLFVNENLLTSIAIRAKGDIRAAINDLHSVSRTKDPSLLEFHERDKEIDIFHALRHVFKGKPLNETMKIFDSVNLPIDEIMLWVEENIPLEYGSDPEAIAKAFDALSKVDIFKRRIYRQQYWRFLVYENILLSYGISASKNYEKSDTGFTSYQKPSRILKIWLNNQKTAKKKSIAEKYARYVHVGYKRAMNEFPIIKKIIISNPIIAKELKLTEDEVGYLRG